MTRLTGVRSLSRMLTASSSVPNSQTPAVPPKPAIWHGVTEGLANAKQAIACGNLEQAEQLLLELVEFAPAEIRGWKLLAKTQRELGHIHEGLVSARRALALQNQQACPEAPASLTLARLLWQQHEHERAREMLALLKQRQPDDPRLLETEHCWNRGEEE